MQSLSRTKTPRMVQCVMAAALVGLAGGISTSAISDEFTRPEVVVDNFAFSVVMPKASAPGSYMDIKIMGPHDEFVVNERVDGGAFDWVPNGPDGLYRYEAVLMVPAASKGGASNANEGMGFERVRSFGTFEIRNGEVLPEQPAGDRLDNQLSAGERLLNSLLNALVPAAHAQDLTASSTGPSVRFDDTQDEVCTPAYDWLILGDGGTSDTDTNNLFQIIGVGEGAGPCAEDITIVSLAHDGNNSATASSINSIVVPANGDMNLANGSFFIDRSANFAGIGTTTPARELHIFASSGATEIRMESGGSNWEIQPGFIGFWLNQLDGSGSGIVKIQNGAPVDSLVVDSAGAVGLGTSLPGTPLHVLRSDGTASIFVQEASGTTAARVLYRMNNNGPPVLNFQNTNAASDGTWTYTVTDAGTFRVNAAGSGLPIEMDLFEGGDMTIGGTLTEGSSRAIKDAIVSVDPGTVLAKLEALEIAEWSYDGKLGQRHIGPMAEDFHATFGLGPDNKHIAPKDLAGVALAAAKALKQENNRLLVKAEQKDRQIEALEARMARLESLLDQK